MSEANDFLMGGGIKSASFPHVGAEITGTIIREPEVQQQRDFKTGNLKFWDDGKPMQQLKVVLATDLRDPEVDEDNGERALYIKGQMLKVVREAIKAVGAKGLEVGGRPTVKYVEDGPANGGGYPPKIYTASYVKAPNVAANDFLNGGGQAAPAPAPVPAMAGAPAAAPAGIDPAALAALQNLTPEQRATLGL